MAAGEGRAAMVIQAHEREAGYRLHHKPRHNIHTVYCGRAVSAVLELKITFLPLWRGVKH